VIDRPVHRLAEWSRAELPYGQPTDADLALAARIGRDGTNRVHLVGFMTAGCACPAERGSVSSRLSESAAAALGMADSPPTGKNRPIT
jgi:hypothetical protein